MSLRYHNKQNDKKYTTIVLTLVLIIFSFFILNNTIENSPTGLSIEPITQYQEEAFVEDEIINELNYVDEVPAIIILKESESDMDAITGAVIGKNIKNNTLTEQEIDLIQEKVLNKIKTEPTIIEKIFNINSNIDLDLDNKYEIVPAISGTLSKEGFEKLKTDPNVKSIYFNHQLRTTLQESTQIIKSDIVNSNLNLDGTNAPGVCVIDTGIDNNHPAFSGKVLAQSCSVSSGNKCPPSGTSTSNNAQDDAFNSHGTHVAGIVASDGTYKGVGPSINLVIFKACDNNGACSGNDIAKGIEFCVQNRNNYNIKIITMSIGDGGRYNTQTACPTFMDSWFDLADSVGIRILAASGNEGYTNGINYPACNSKVISVSSTTKTDTISSFSNRGALLDIMAPGSSIKSTKIGGTYGLLSGTSMATPHIAGSIALILENENNNGRSITKNEIVNVMKNTGKDISGYKRIDLLAVMNSLNNNNPPNLVISNNQENLSGTSMDDHDGDISNYINWNSNIDGNLGIGSSATLSTYGSHSITATSTDSGLLTSTVQITIDWNDPNSTNTTNTTNPVNSTNQTNTTNPVNSTNSTSNTPPNVTITSMSTSSTAIYGQDIYLKGEAGDLEDGNISANIIWTSNIDGTLGQGALISYELSEGSHTITASVTDSGGLSDQDTSIINIESQSEQGNCIIELDANQNNIIEISDLIMLLQGIVNENLMDIDGNLCNFATSNYETKTGNCLIDADQNNNNIIEVGDAIIIASKIVGIGNLTDIYGEQC